MFFFHVTQCVAQLMPKRGSKKYTHAQTVFTLTILFNGAEHARSIAIIKHKYMLMCNYTICIKIMLCLWTVLLSSSFSNTTCIGQFWVAFTWDSMHIVSYLIIAIAYLSDSKQGVVVFTCITVFICLRVMLVLYYIYVALFRSWRHFTVALGYILWCSPCLMFKWHYHHVLVCTYVYYISVVYTA